MPERRWAIAAIWLALTLTVVDASIANVALPAIAHQLHANDVDSIWVVNAYQLAIAVSLLPLAALGEIVMFRRIFLAGLLVFILASLACSLSRSLPELVLARVLQGLGAAGVMSMNGALVRFVFPARMLGQGVGLNAMVISIAAVVAPSVASAILAVASWPWLFAVNIPIGFSAFFVGLRALPSSPRSGGRLDLVASLINVVCYGLTVGGLDLVTRSGHIIAGAVALAFGLLSGWLLIRRSLPQKKPLVPLDLLRNRLFALTVATSVISFSAQLLAFVALPFFFEAELHRSQVQTGLLMSAWPLAVGVAAPISGRLADRFPAALLGGIGLGLLSVGLALLAMVPTGAGVADIMGRMAICGVGFGFFQAPNNRLLLGSAPLHRAGAAGGMLAFARLTGQTAGTTLAAILFSLAANGPVVSLWMGAAVAAAGIVVSLLRIRVRDQAFSPIQ
jgi:DHA2 family multidrug resistance protein-like MFS transporter